MGFIREAAAFDVINSLIPESREGVSRYKTLQKGKNGLQKLLNEEQIQGLPRNFRNITFKVGR